MRSSRGRLSSDGLTYFEALKFRMLKVERTSCLVTGTRVRGPELLRFGPLLEGSLALPHGMRGVERIVFLLRPLEQMKLQEARNSIEIRIPSQPHFFKSVLGTFFHTKPIHGDEHLLGLLCPLAPAYCWWRTPHSIFNVRLIPVSRLFSRSKTI